MTQYFELRPGQELAYRRVVEFAVELLDAVTLERISADVKVTAEGLRGKPILNASGLFVWLREDRAGLRRLVIEPMRLPYERRQLEPFEINSRLTTVLLEPRVDYPFPAGFTALRGTLIEKAVTAANAREPIAGAEMQLRWLDDDAATWRESPIKTRTNAHGDFSAALRFGPADSPLVQSGKVTVRLRVRRSGLVDRESGDFQLYQGRTAEPSTFTPDPNALTFAWDDLHL